MCGWVSLSLSLSVCVCVCVCVCSPSPSVCLCVCFYLCLTICGSSTPSLCVSARCVGVADGTSTEYPSPRSPYATTPAHHMPHMAVIHMQTTRPRTLSTLCPVCTPQPVGCTPHLVFPAVWCAPASRAGSGHRSLSDLQHSHCAAQIWKSSGPLHAQRHAQAASAEPRTISASPRITAAPQRRGAGVPTPLPLPPLPPLLLPTPPLPLRSPGPKRPSGPCLPP